MDRTKFRMITTMPAVRVTAGIVVPGLLSA